MLVLGVGSRESGDGQWGAVRGSHGYGVANDAGKEFLSFLSCHQETVCNTWFVKRDIHKQTWQHPKTKQWSCMDFVVMKQRDSKLCMDVAARRGAMCNTDHHLVLAKLKLRQSGCRRSVLGGRTPKVKRYDVGKFTGKEGGQDVCEQYQEEVVKRVSEAWPDEEGVQEKWLTDQSVEYPE